MRSKVTREPAHIAAKHTRKPHVVLDKIVLLEFISISRNVLELVTRIVCIIDCFVMKGCEIAQVAPIWMVIRHLPWINNKSLYRSIPHLYIYTLFSGPGQAVPGRSRSGEPVAGPQHEQQTGQSMHSAIQYRTFTAFFENLYHSPSILGDSRMSQFSTGP
jgi:hypothetical protein